MPPTAVRQGDPQMHVTIKEYFSDTEEASYFEGVLIFKDDYAEISFDVERETYTYKGQRVREAQWLLECASNRGKATLNKSLLSESGYEGTLIFCRLNESSYQSMWEIEPAAISDAAG